MRARFTLLAVLCNLGLAHAQLTSADAESQQRLRKIVLESRHLGAHGLGYNEQSLKILSQRLAAPDIPVLVELLADKELRVGAQFALASQCDAAIAPVREGAIEHKISFLDADDILLQIEDYSGCSQEVRDRAATIQAELRSLNAVNQARLQQEAKEKAAEDARIQRNALRMMDPKQAKELTRQEREEVYRRSLKAAGLKEDGPLTPAQRDLIQRMYRTMVLGESGGRPPN